MKRASSLHTLYKYVFYLTTNFVISGRQPAARVGSGRLSESYINTQSERCNRYMSDKITTPYKPVHQTNGISAVLVRRM